VTELSETPDGHGGRRPRRWERRTSDSEGEPIVEVDTEARAEWREKWAPPCPVGNPQLPCHALGFRERNACELELRVPLTRGEGVCEVIVDEGEDEVYVRVVVCYVEDEDEAGRPEYTNWPVRVWLDGRLGERAVIDVDTDEEIPLYKPEYMNGIPQPDHGYYPANRRRARPSG
jgi:hypothetical protein